MNTYSVPAQPDTFARVANSLAAFLPLALLGLYNKLQAEARGAPYLERDLPALAALAGCCVRTLSPKLHQLEAAGVLRIERPGQGHPNIYHFVEIPLRTAKDKPAREHHSPVVRAETGKDMPKQAGKTCRSRSATSTDHSYIDPKIEDQESPPPTPSRPQADLVVGGGEGSEPELVTEDYGDDPIQVHANAWSIDETLHLDPADCLALARQACANGRPVEYIEELLRYVTTNPTIYNPAGCFRDLVLKDQQRPKVRTLTPSRATPTRPLDDAYRQRHAHLFNNRPPSPLAWAT